MLHLKAQKPESAERTELLKQIEELESRHVDVRKKLQDYEENDPEVFEKMKENTKVSEPSCLTWIDSCLEAEWRR